MSWKNREDPRYFKRTFRIHKTAKGAADSQNTASWGIHYTTVFMISYIIFFRWSSCDEHNRADTIGGCRQEPLHTNSIASWHFEVQQVAAHCISSAAWPNKHGKPPMKHPGISDGSALDENTSWAKVVSLGYSSVVASCREKQGG